MANSKADITLCDEPAVYFTPNNGLVAVVMAAGYFENTRDIGVPKPLLPIGKKKLIWYPVNWLAENKFDNVIIVTYAHLKEGIYEALIDLNISTMFHVIPESCEGTLNALCLLGQALEVKTQDLFVVNCDVITSMKLNKFMDVHRTYEASITQLLTPRRPLLEVLPGDRMVYDDQELDYVIRGFKKVKDTVNRVIFQKFLSDCKDGCVLNDKNYRALLCELGSMQLRMNYDDAHVYVIKNWVFKYICEQNKEGSFRREFLPEFIGKQFADDSVMKTPDVCEEYDYENNFPQKEDTTDIYYYARKYRDSQRSNDYNLDRNKRSYNDVISVNALICDETTIVVNTLASFTEANRMFIRHDCPFPLKVARVSADVKSADHVTISNDSLVDDRTVIAENNIIKRSVIGKSCHIGSGCKISNSIIMDHVTLASGCQIQGSIICSHASIGEKCEIQNTFVPNRHIAAKSKLVQKSIEQDGGHITQ